MIPRRLPPLLPALTTLYLCLPTLLFIYGWIRLRVAVISLLFVSGVILLALWDITKVLYAKHASLQNISWKSVLRLYAPALIVLIAWLCLSGAGGVGLQAGDYRASNALLKDLIVRDWPLKIKFDDNVVPVVYYMGYFLIAAWVGKILGWTVANVCMLISTLLAILLVFAWFVKISTVQINNRASRLLALALILCLAGGMDFIGFYVLRQHSLDISTHVEWWAWPGTLQYSSNNTLLLWVPQHALSSWLVAGLVASSILEPQDLKYLGVSLAASIIWSPFGPIGILPYLLVLIVVYLRPENRYYVFNPICLICNTGALWVGGVFLAYITANQLQFVKGFIWEVTLNSNLWIISTLLQFWILEFGLLAFLLGLLLIPGYAVLRRAQLNQTRSWRQRWYIHWQQNLLMPPRLVVLFLVSVLTLFILPLLKFGQYNELLMRGSIPALFILWAFSAKVILDASLRLQIRRKLVYSLLILVLLIGFHTASNDVLNSIYNYHLGPPDWSSIPKSQAVNSPQEVQQRLGDVNAWFYQYLSK